MNISPINVISFSKNFNYKNNEQIQNRYNIPYDSVSFSGKKNTTKQEYSESAQEGIRVGKKIMKLARSNSLDYETLDKVLNENSPVSINVEDISNIPGMAKVEYGRTVAQMLPGYTPDYKLAVANIYLGALPRTSKEQTDFAANVAHEYTHVLQRAKDQSYYGIIQYTQNQNEVITIGRTSQQLMHKMVKICQQRLVDSENKMKAVIDSILNNRFDIEKSLGQIDFSKMIDSISSTLAQQLNKNPKDMKNAVKGWIIQETQNEKEAYDVTLDILESSKHDPYTKASRIFSREIFSYINKTLKN